MTTGIFLGLSIILLGIYIVLRLEWAGGLSERLQYSQTLSRQMDAGSNLALSKLEVWLMKVFKLRYPPKEKTNSMLLAIAGVFLLCIATKQSTSVIFAVAGCFLLAFIMPYASAHSFQEEWEDGLDKEVSEMFEVFNFYISSGISIDEALTQTSDNTGEKLSPNLKTLVSNMMLEAKDDAVEHFAQSLYFNQNIQIFASALKQAIKGYEDTLSSFVATQSKLYTQLKNEEIEEIIMKMPTKFGMVSGLLIITMIFFLVVPVFTKVFTDMNAFIRF